MSKSKIKWYAVHEAGRATMALVLGQPLTVVVASDAQLMSATIFEEEAVLRTEEVSSYIARLCAGYAAETVYHERRNGHQLDEASIEKALQRCAPARRIFFDTVWADEEMPWDCKEACAIWADHAQHARQILSRNEVLFDQVREHLSKN